MLFCTKKGWISCIKSTTHIPKIQPRPSMHTSVSDRTTSIYTKRQTNIDFNFIGLTLLLHLKSPAPKGMSVYIDTI